MLVIPAARSLRQESQKFKVGLCYTHKIYEKFFFYPNTFFLFSFYFSHGLNLDSESLC